MCGIVGYIGKKPIKNELIRMLRLLEYRGYDSAGIGVIKNGKINVFKSVGNITSLEKALPKQIDSTIGIGHTRWATHGKPTLLNAHPHCSQSGEFAVVHNGIIENYKELKRPLELLGTKFYSSTDTEVIAKLLEQAKGNTVISKIISTTNKLSGSFALAILHRDDPNTIFVAKQKSPLFVGNDGAQAFVASDPACINSAAVTTYSIADGEFAAVTCSKITFYNSLGEIINKEPINTPAILQESAAKKTKYYMKKEIAEIPDCLTSIINYYADEKVFSYFSAEKIKSIKRIKLVGCGTAYHACEMGASFLEKYFKKEATAHIASEFRYSCPIINKNTLCIFISQSGETADTIGAAELAQKSGAPTVVITNCLHSTLAKMADCVLPVLAKREVAVASTKAFVGQVAVCYALAGYLAKTASKKGKKLDYLTNLNLLNSAYKIYPKAALTKLINLLTPAKDAFFIGRGSDYIICQEASLKIKEICYINCNAYPAGELKHGFIALVEDGTIMFTVATNKSLLPKTLNGINEVKSRGGKIILVSQFKEPDIEAGLCAEQITLPDAPEDLMPLIAISPLFSLAYYTSLARGNNPDMPRNLAKSVTVE